MNSAQLVNTPAGKLLNISLEYDAGDPSMSIDAPAGTSKNPLAWAQRIIDANPGVPTIISTHNNVGINGSRAAAGVRMVDALARQNDQVIAILNGHSADGDKAEVTQTITNDFGRPVYQMLTDYQGRNRGGDGWMRLLTFDTDAKQIQVKTYTPVTSAELGTRAGAEYGNVGRVDTSAIVQFNLKMDLGQRFAAKPVIETKTVVFQNGLNGYTGTQDTQIREVAPTATAGGNVNLGVDGDDDSDTTNADVKRTAMVKFDNLFGPGVGQVSTDYDIVSAKLVIHLNELASSNAEGSGAKLHRMRAAWNESTATWDNVGSAGNGVTTSGAGLDAMARPESERGFDGSGASVGSGLLSFTVTRSVRAWMNGAENQGWALVPYANGSNGIFFDSSEATSAGSIRPQLILETTATPVTKVTFRNGLAGYMGTVDTQISAAAPTTSLAGKTTLTVDASVEDNSPSGSDTQGLLRFENIIGSQVGQVPVGASVTSAVLKLQVSEEVSNSVGGGFYLYRLTRAWSENDTWATLGDGISLVSETMTDPDDFEGIDSTGVGVDVGTLYLDVTASVQAWAYGEANYGWVLVPMENSVNAVIFGSSEYGGLEPELVVRYLPRTGAVVPEPAGVAGVVAVSGMALGRRRREVGR